MAAKTEFEPPKPTFSGRRPFSSDLSGGDYPTEDVDRSLRQNYREALESLGRKLHYACDPKTTGIEAPQRKYTKLLLTSVLVFALGPGTVTQAQTPAEGIDVVDVVRVRATVQNLDSEKRSVTLLFDDNRSKTIKVDKSVQNFDQVKVGDHLKLALTEEMIIVIGRTGETSGAAGLAGVSVAPKGTKPGMVTVEAIVISGRILAVNAKNHKVTLQQPDGNKKTLTVSKKVKNLDQLKAGDSVDIGITEDLAVEVVR